jgi:hypothetical protein
MKEKRLLEVLSLLFLFVFLIFCFSGCAATRHMIQKGTVSTLDTSIDDLVDKLLNTKNLGEVRHGIAGALLVVTGLTELSPNNYRMLSKCAMLYAACGLIIEDENPAYAVQLYQTGAEYGLRALKLNRKFRKGLEQGLDYHKFVKSLGPDYVDAATWTAAAMGLKLLLTMEDAGEAMAVPHITALAGRSMELNDSYFYGLAQLLFGAIYAILPEFAQLGGGEASSRREFEAADKITGGKFLLVKVFKARFYAPLVKDMELFKKLLNETLETDSAILPNGYLLNELAKANAKFVLEHMTDYFPE